jgi:hypothetical protein
LTAAAQETAEQESAESEGETASALRTAVDELLEESVRPEVAEVFFALYRVFLTSATQNIQPKMWWEERPDLLVCDSHHRGFAALWPERATGEEPVTETHYNLAEMYELLRAHLGPELKSKCVVSMANALLLVRQAFGELRKPYLRRVRALRRYVRGRSDCVALTEALAAHLSACAVPRRPGTAAVGGGAPADPLPGAQQFSIELPPPRRLLPAALAVTHSAHSLQDLVLERLNLLAFRVEQACANAEKRKDMGAHEQLTDGEMRNLLYADLAYNPARTRTWFLLGEMYRVSAHTEVEQLYQRLCERGAAVSSEGGLTLPDAVGSPLLTAEHAAVLLDPAHSPHTLTAAVRTLQTAATSTTPDAEASAPTLAAITNSTAAANTTTTTTTANSNASTSATRSQPIPALMAGLSFSHPLCRFAFEQVLPGEVARRLALRCYERVDRERPWDPALHHARGECAHYPTRLFASGHTAGGAAEEENAYARVAAAHYREALACGTADFMTPLLLSVLPTSRVSHAERQQLTSHALDLLEKQPRLSVGLFTDCRLSDELLDAHPHARALPALAEPAFFTTAKQYGKAVSQLRWHRRWCTLVAVRAVAADLPHDRPLPAQLYSTLQLHAVESVPAGAAGTQTVFTVDHFLSKVGHELARERKEVWRYHHIAHEVALAELVLRHSAKNAHQIIRTGKLFTSATYPAVYLSSPLDWMPAVRTLARHQYTALHLRVLCQLGDLTSLREMLEQLNKDETPFRSALLPALRSAIHALEGKAGGSEVAEGN